ncbi:GyrI-like domain-containing protein [Phreatobacter sp. AB_2022a]|uniref:GyrI-like domain-containing protein n=1 Tax=Phreatobacter sp. AB_2022a TaxID=3003134 RepID=UPI0022870287|nr:GyrI-like domain-containing protein [Phreatobacter sp. AB_2022a]MCZ0734779.1 GyrI-like domain-containing protein [Phreatobacter sp. AB_2022a]
MKPVLLFASVAGLMAFAPLGQAAAQAPAPAPQTTQPAEPAPSQTQAAPAAPAPADPAAPQAQPQPATPAPNAATAQTGDGVDAAGFGDEVTLTARPALVLPGKATWDDLYGTFRRSLDELAGIAAAQNLTRSGPPMIRFLSSTDEQADFEAILPVSSPLDQPDKLLPALPGMTPGGQAYRFVHFGGYDTMEQTYDEITNFLDERSIQAEDSFVEEYVRDPKSTSEVDLATYIYVFPKR